MKKILIFLPLVCSMCACGIYTRYSRPQTDTIEAYMDGDVAADTAGIAVRTWPEMFTDKYLQTLITAGLERNTDLSVARLRIEESQAVLDNARLSYLPSVTLNPQAGISHYDGETKKTYNLGAAASWELDIFGRVTNAKRGAAAGLEASREYVQAVRTQLIATVAENYYTLLLLDEQLSVYWQTAVVWDETIATLEALAEAGKTNDVAVRQARAERTLLDASILSVRKNISATENSLSALLKEPCRTIERGLLSEQSFPDEIAAGIPLCMLSNRPDVRQAEAELSEAFYATNAARGAFYPTLTLSGTFGWTNSGGGSIVNPGKWLSSAIAQLVAPLFNKGANTANLKIAEARQQEALLLFEQSLIDAGREVNDALVEWQTADERIRLDEERIADLQAAVEKTQLLVRYTSANYLEVLTAQQSLLNARLTLSQDRISKIQGVIHLYHALGGGAD